MTLRYIFTNYILERYDPGKPASIRRLQRVRRFRLSRRVARRIASWSDPVAAVAVLLTSKGYQETRRWTFGIVYERKRAVRNVRLEPKYDRVFVFYRQMVNVILVDHILKECLSFIREGSNRDVRRNIMFLLTDMENSDEVGSAAAGTINFLGKVSHGRSLGTFLLDICHGRLYYQLDRSLIPWRHRLFLDRMRLAFVRNAAKLSEEAVRTAIVPGRSVAVIRKVGGVRAKRGRAPKIKRPAGVENIRQRQSELPVVRAPKISVPPPDPIVEDESV